MSFWSDISNSVTTSSAKYAPGGYKNIPSGLTYQGERTWGDEDSGYSSEPIFTDSQGKQVYYTPAVGGEDPQAEQYYYQKENGDDGYSRDPYLTPAQVKRKEQWGDIDVQDPWFKQEFFKTLQEGSGGANNVSMDQLADAWNSSGIRLGSGSNPYNAALQVLRNAGLNPQTDQARLNQVGQQAVDNSPENRLRAAYDPGGFMGLGGTNGFLGLGNIGDFGARALAMYGGVSGLAAAQAAAGAAAGAGGVIPEFDYTAGGSNGMYNPSAISYPVETLANPAPIFNPNSTVGDPLYGGQGGGIGESGGGGVGTSAGGAIPGFDINNPSTWGGGPQPGYGAAAAITPGLIQRLAEYTGLSTGAIERLGGAAISSLAGLYGANKLGQASMDAANRLAGANQTATQLQSKMYEDQVARQQPFYQAGVNALPDYTKGVMPGGNLVRPFSMADYQADPGYGFRMSEGMKALDRSAASRGGLLSGATMKGAERYGQDLASQEYNNAYNRYVGNQATQRNALAGLTGFAPTAAQQLGAAGTNYANTAGNLGINTATNYGNADLTSAAARQSAYGGAGGAFANALSPNPYNAFLNRQLGVIG